jgi:hypothetical protein
MPDYSNAELKLINFGLQLVLPPELVPQGQYTRLVNVRTLKEGQMATRNGFHDLGYDFEEFWRRLRDDDSVLYSHPFGRVKYMTPLSDAVLLFVMESGDVLYGQKGELSVLTVPEEIREMGIDRDIPRVPLRLIDYYEEGKFSQLGPRRRGSPTTGAGVVDGVVRVDNVSSVKFTSPFSGDDWTYLATQVGMYKIQVIGAKYDGEASTATAFRWGIRPPLSLNYVDEDDFSFEETQLTGEIVDCPEDDDGECDCGLNTKITGGIRYDWVYTYYSSFTGSESNPSGLMKKTFGIDPGNSACCPCSGTRETVQLSGFIPSSDPQVDRIRLYRRGGSLPIFMLEEELPWNVETYTCYKYDNTIGALGIILDIDRDVPFTTIQPPVDSESGLDPGEIPADGVEPVDDGEDEGVKEATAIFETPLPWAWGPYAGRYIFAVGDPERPGVVYWTKGAPAPDNSGEIYATQVSSSAEPLINGFIFGGESYVWTSEKLYALDWNGYSVAGGEFTPREIPLSMGISSPKAFTTSPQGVFFLSKDGIFKTDCSSFADPITKDTLRPIFLGKEAYGLKPIDWDRSDDIQMEVASQEFHFLYYDTEGDRKHLIYDIQHKRWQEFKLAFQFRRFEERTGEYVISDTTYSGTDFVVGIPNRPNYVVYMAGQNTRIYTNTDDNEFGDELQIPAQYLEVPVNVRTGANDFDTPLTYKEFGVALFDIEPAPGGITVTPYYEGESVAGAPILLTGTGRQTISKSLGDVYARNISYDFEWDGPGVIHRVVTLYRQDEEGTVHWEHPETSFGIPGWKHMRDGYWGLRSDADVTLRVVVDGDEFTYTLPSTGGERRKVYIKYLPTKGKMYRFFLDSEEPFRTYASDTYMYIKQWHTGNTYRPTPLGGSGGAF